MVAVAAVAAAYAQSDSAATDTDVSATIKMAKPLLTNHTNHHQPHSALITLTKDEKSIDRSQQCSELLLNHQHHHHQHHHQELPPRLLFTATAPAKRSSPTSSTATKAATTPTSQPDDVKPQAIFSARIPYRSPASVAANKKQQQLNSSSVHRAHHPAFRRSGLAVANALGVTRAPAAAAASRQAKLQPASSVINRSASAASTGVSGLSGDGGDGGAETGNVTARLLDMGKRLLDAAREGQTDHVRQLVVGSGAPFTSDWLGTTALHLAAQYGHAEIAEILLRGGVNRDARTKLERTALHLAAQSGSLPVVESLLIHGTDINARDMLKMTPLHWAVERRHIDIVRRLLVGGADIDVRSKFQLTPLDIAQNSGYYEIVELFKVS